MTGKDIVLQAMKNKKTERTPYVPFVGVHGASLLGISSEDYLKSPDLMLEGVAKAVELYKPDGLPVCFDLQIEAEILGCSLVWARENPPAVASHVLQEKKLSELPPLSAQSGRIPAVLKVTREAVKLFPDIAFYGLITGPFTLALHLMGPEIFMDMYDKPEYVQEVMAFCTDVAKKMSDYYIDSGADIVALVDPMTSQISPDAFREFVTEYCADIFSHIRERGRLSSFFVCGHAQKNVEAMCDCGPDNVSIDENIPLDYVRDIARSKGVSFGGNMKLTTVMLFGEENDNLRHAAECIAVAGDSGFILAPGCDIPYAVPPRNISAVSEMVKDEYKLKVAMSLAGTEKAVTTDLDLSDYGGSDRIKIDIITLDSEACAPCQYMVESVKKILPEFEGILDWKEHKIKSKESIELMMALNVKNIPTICIDGNIAFVSQIPRKEELAAAVYKRMIERARYRKAAAKILFLADDSEESRELKENIGKAQRELGTTIIVEEVRDKKKIESEFGVKKLPAVITVREELRSFGKVADKEVVKEWIKAII